MLQGFLVRSCGLSRNDGLHRAHSFHYCDRHALPGCTTPQNTSPRPQLVRLRRKNGGNLLCEGQIIRPFPWSSLSPGFTSGQIDLRFEVSVVVADNIF